MKRAFRFTGVALAGALAGFLVVRVKDAPAREAAVAQASRAGMSDSASLPRPAADPEAGPVRHDLAALLKWARQREASGSPMAREMERLSNDELRALLIDPPENDRTDPRSQSNIAQLAAKELFKREGAAAFDWVAGLDDGIRKTVYPRILQAALAEDAIAYKARFDDYVKENGEGAAESFIYPMIGGATERGAEDLIQLRKAYGVELIQFIQPMGSLPDDFDFHRFFAAMPDLGIGMCNTFQYWSAKDKEAAWSGFKGLAASDKGVYLPNLFDGVAAVAGAAKAAEWLAPKLAELSDAQRAQALGYFGLTGPLEAETVSALIPLLASDADRMKLAQRAVASSTRGASAGAVALAALASDEQRAEVLLDHVRNYGYDTMPPASRSRYRGELEKMMEQVKLPQAMRDQVTAEMEPRRGGG